MLRNSITLLILITLEFGGHAGFSQSSHDLNKLSVRAVEYWKFAAAGERVKASSYVASAKRDSYLNSAPPPFADPKLLGIQFTTDPERIIVRVSVKPVGIDTPLSIIEQPWIWANNNWFIDLADNVNPFKPSANATQNPAVIREIEQHFRLKTTEVSVGTIWQGNYPDFPIEFEYTGESPIRIGGDSRVPFIGFNPPENQYLPKGSKTFQLRIDSSNFEGPFSVPVRLTIYYKDVSIERTLRVDGAVFHPIRITQVPESLLFQSGE